jgi:hypothetical protein
LQIHSITNLPNPYIDLLPLLSIALTLHPNCLSNPSSRFAWEQTCIFKNYLPVAALAHE